MSGISLSGLINGSFDWQSVVTELIQIDSAPITALQNNEATNNTQLSALAQLGSDATSLQTASQALQADGVFDGVSAASTTPNSTWTAAAASGSDARVETLYIAYHAIAAGNMSDADRGYLAALVAAQTGIAAPEAQRRVDEFTEATLSAANKAKESADAARKAAAQGSLYTALALLIGAFIASVCAAVGGRLRDEHA